MQPVFVCIPALLSASRESIQLAEDQTFVMTVPDGTVIHGRDATGYSFVIQKGQLNPSGELLPLLHMVAFRTTRQTVLLRPGKEAAKKGRNIRCTVRELQEALRAVCQPGRDARSREADTAPGHVSTDKRLSLSNRAQKARMISQSK